MPEKGYSGLHEKSLITCGDSSWKYIKKDEADPFDPAGRPLSESRANEIASAAGAWAYKNRYIVNGDPTSVQICRKGVYAITMTRWDLITFCDPSFTAPVTGAPSPIDGKAGVQIDTKLDSFGQFSLSRIMIHELAHWYGSGGSGTASDRRGK